MRAMKCMFVGIYLLVIAAFCLMVGTMYNLSAVAFVCLTCAVLSPVFPLSSAFAADGKGGTGADVRAERKLRKKDALFLKGSVTTNG